MHPTHKDVIENLIAQGIRDTMTKVSKYVQDNALVNEATRLEIIDIFSKHVQAAKDHIGLADVLARKHTREGYIQQYMDSIRTGDAKEAVKALHALYTQVDIDSFLKGLKEDGVDYVAEAPDMVYLLLQELCSPTNGLTSKQHELVFGPGFEDYVILTHSKIAHLGYEDWLLDPGADINQRGYSMNDSSVLIDPIAIVQYVQSVWGPMVSGLTDDQLVYVLEAGSVSMPLMGWMNQEIVDATIELQKMFGSEYRHLSLLCLGTPLRHPLHERYRPAIHKELLKLKNATPSAEDANHMVNVLMGVRKNIASRAIRKWSIDELIRLFNDISIQTVDYEVADRFRSDQLCQRLVEGVHSAVMHAAMSVDGFERDEAAAIMANQLLSIADDKDALLRLVGAGISVANDNRRGMRQYFDNEFSRRQIGWQKVMGSPVRSNGRHYPSERPLALDEYLESLPDNFDKFAAEIESSEWCRILKDSDSDLRYAENLLTDLKENLSTEECSIHTAPFHALFYHQYERIVLEMIIANKLGADWKFSQADYDSAAASVAVAYEYLLQRFPRENPGRLHFVIRMLLGEQVFEDLVDLAMSILRPGSRSRSRF